jgi:hypothetical protein
MLFRVVHFLIGAVLAGGGGYLAWTAPAGAVNLFPPGPSGLPLALLGGLFGVTTGLVFLVSALHPRPNQKRRAAEKVAREDAALTQAEAYYSERSRAADRDWRSADIAPLPTPSPATPVPPPQPPAAAVAPPPPPPPAPPPNPFPSAVNLNPIPRTQDVAPAPIAPTPASEGPYATIRSAIAAGKLAEADKMLNAARDTATGLALAQLTALAGDHAAASGQPGHAKWLWKLALKRFGELDATASPEAVRVAASLRGPI